MYLGRIVELGATASLFGRAFHPYTQALLAATPGAGRGKVEFAPPRGEIASPFEAPAGCHFHPRCQFATQRCSEQAPELREVAPQHFAACHNAEILPSQ